jgi:thioredoxin 2
MSDTSAIIRCINCLTLNRVPQTKLKGTPACGNCKETLHIPSEPTFAKQGSLDRSIAHWAETLLLEFTAPMCLYCKILDPLVNSMARDRMGKLKVIKVDIESDAYLAERFKIEKTPTFIVYRNGVELIRVDGAPKEKTDLVKWVDNLINFSAL